jgi:membrane protein
VRARPALAGAVVAVLLLELNQFLFVSWVKGSVGYNLLYGTFAAFPIFLAWMYSNWVVVLIGVEVGYLAQNVPGWLREAEEPGQLAWEDRERLALASAALLAAHGELEPERVAEELQVSPRLVHRPLDDLQDAGWLEPVCDSNGQMLGYRALPALAATRLADLRRSLRELGEETPAGVRHRALLTAPSWMSVLEPLEREADRPFETWSVRELAERLQMTLAARHAAESAASAAGAR